MEESAEQIPLSPRRGGASGHPFVRPVTPIVLDDVRYWLPHLQQRFDEAQKARDADNNQLTVERVERMVQAALSDRPRTDESRWTPAQSCKTLPLDGIVGTT